MNARSLGHSWFGGGAPRLRNSRSSLHRLASAQGGGLFVALVLLSLYFSVATGSFFTRSNILVVLEQISVLGIVAVPGAMLLVSGNLDLSVGSVGLARRPRSASSTRSSAGRSGSPRWARSRSGRPGAR